ncbi:hypothetical protein [Peribacillus acanthi]|uniref:phage adaptor protein n=1 Tax=Peribacillus acanthi TaxID=2171554 RepID=UPI000D3E4BC7|nr:hypothetical protein [Peribacillus acanthi]
MKLSQLIQEVSKDIDDTLSNADITGWLNRAIDDLTPYAKHKKIATIQTVIDQKNYELPSDFRNLEHLFDEGIKRELALLPMDDTYNRGYKKWGNTLILQPVPKEAGELTLYYHAKLPRLVNPDDEPVIPSEYHDLLVLYAVAKAKYQDEEESMQAIAMNEYYARREQFITFSQTGEIYQIQDVYW